MNANFHSELIDFFIELILFLRLFPIYMKIKRCIIHIQVHSIRYYDTQLGPFVEMYNKIAY